MCICICIYIQIYVEYNYSNNFITENFGFEMASYASI